MSSCGCVGSAYNYGTQIRFTVLFTNAVTTVPEDPTEIILGIKYEGYPTTNFYYTSGQVQKDSIGNYHYDYTSASGGTYYYAWQGTGAVIAATASIPFTVTDNLFG